VRRVEHRGHCRELRPLRKLRDRKPSPFNAFEMFDLTPSGSDKSTSMNILGCLDVPTTNAYKFRGVRVERLSRDQRILLRRHFPGFVFHLPRFQPSGPHHGPRERRTRHALPRPARRKAPRSRARIPGLVRAPHLSERCDAQQEKLTTSLALLPTAASPQVQRLQ
jgi:hypothetical protein